MSTCISQHGEFSDHTLNDVFECTRCGVLDEDTLLAEVRRLRTENAGLREALEASQVECAKAWPVCVCPDCTKCGCANPWRHHAYPTDEAIERVAVHSSTHPVLDPGRDAMSLHFVLRVNDEPIGSFCAQRQEREVPADRVCTYDVMVDHMGVKSRVTVRHNFDAGAFALVQTALAAALSAPSEPAAAIAELIAASSLGAALASETTANLNGPSAVLSAPPAPVQDGPRVWAIPAFPDDWRAFRDAEGRVWRLDEARCRWVRDTGAWTEADPTLLLRRHPRLSPLTEIVEESAP